MAPGEGTTAKSPKEWQSELEIQVSGARLVSVAARSEARDAKRGADEAQEAVRQVREENARRDVMFAATLREHGAQLKEHGEALNGIARDTEFFREVVKPIAKWVGKHAWKRISLALGVLATLLFGGGYAGVAQLKPEIREQTEAVARNTAEQDLKRQQQQIIDAAIDAYRREHARQLEAERVRQLEAMAAAERRANMRDPDEGTARAQRRGAARRPEPEQETEDRYGLDAAPPTPR